MEIFTSAVAPFFKNGYLVSSGDAREAVIIDPGDEVDALIAAARDARVRVTAILLTHAHLDHITGVGRAKAAFDVPVWLHPDDLFFYDGILEQGAMFGLPVETQPPVDRFYAADTEVRFGDCVVDVHHTPGHCPGGVCLAIGPVDAAERTLFVGDTLFAGSIGRTDLPGGSYDRLMASIRNVLLAFPDTAEVYSGHGPATTIGNERRTNPFLQPAAR